MLITSANPMHANGYQNPFPNSARPPRIRTLQTARPHIRSIAKGHSIMQLVHQTLRIINASQSELTNCKLMDTSSISIHLHDTLRMVCNVRFPPDRTHISTHIVPCLLQLHGLPRYLYFCSLSSVSDKQVLDEHMHCFLFIIQASFQVTDWAS